MKTNINQELLNQIFDDPLEKKIIDVMDMDISDEDKIRIIVEFIRGRFNDRI